MKKLLFILTAILMTTAISTSLYAKEKSAVSFHNFEWKTSMAAFKAKMGNPVHTAEANGFQSLIYDKVSMAGYNAYMVVYFSKNGLEGGAYYFDTKDMEDLKRCYTTVQSELITHYGQVPPAPAGRYDVMLRETRMYQTCWNLPDGYVLLKVNTKTNDPVTLWVSFPTLTKMLD